MLRPRPLWCFWVSRGLGSLASPGSFVQDDERARVQDDERARSVAHREPRWLKLSPAEDNGNRQSDHQAQRIAYTCRCEPSRNEVVRQRKRYGADEPKKYNGKRPAQSWSRIVQSYCGANARGYVRQNVSQEIALRWLV
jgi:hypothetical protein